MKHTVEMVTSHIRNPNSMSLGIVGNPPDIDPQVAITSFYSFKERRFAQYIANGYERNAALEKAADGTSTERLYSSFSTTRDRLTPPNHNDLNAQHVQITKMVTAGEISVDTSMVPVDLSLTPDEIRLAELLRNGFSRIKIKEELFPGGDDVNISKIDRLTKDLGKRLNTVTIPQTTAVLAALALPKKPEEDK